MTEPLLVATAERWLAAMIAVSWQFALLFIIVWSVVRCLGDRLTPAARGVVWLVVLARLVLPFGLEAPFGLAPRPHGVLGPGAGAGRAPLASAAERATHGAPTNSVELAPRDPGSVDSAAAPSLPRARFGPGELAALARAGGLRLAIFAAWLAGVVTISVWRWRRGRHDARGEAAVSPSALSSGLRLGLERSARLLGLRRMPAISLIEGDAIAIRVAGVARPRLLVPAAMARDWSAPALEPVLLHELAHVRRRDPLARGFVGLIQTLFFFHPLVWAAARRVHIDRELACDDLAVRLCSGGRRDYVESLLRAAHEARLRAGEALPSLGVASDEIGLRRRLERILADSYRPARRTSPALVAVTVLALAAGAAGSIYGQRGERVAEPSGASSPRPLRVRFLLVRAIDAGSPEKLAVDAGVPWSGDFDWGGSVEASAAAFKRAIDSPELRAVLARPADGALSYRLVIDSTGSVRDVRATKENAPGMVSSSVAKALRDLRFEPARRRANGEPVWIAVDARLVVEPSASEAHDGALALVGGEGVEVVDVSMPRSTGTSVWDRSFFDRPPYVVLRSRPEPPSGIDAGDGVYSLELEFDSEGRVLSTQPFLFQSANRWPAEAADETAAPMAIRRWVESFELDVPAGSIAGGVTLAGHVDVELRSGQASVATRAPASPEEIRARLLERYRLAPARNLDLLPAPHGAERTLLYRFGSPGQARAIPSGPTRLTIVMDESEHPTYGGAAFGDASVHGLLRSIGYRDHAISGDPALLDRDLDADLILRQGVPPAALLADLETALDERFGLEVDLTAANQPHAAIVLRGSLRELLPNADSDGGVPKIDLYTDRKDETSGGSVATGPAALVLTTLLASAVGMPVVDETIDALQIVQVYIHRSARGTANVEQVLRNVVAQSGLELSIETRSTEVVVVSAATESAEL